MTDTVDSCSVAYERMAKKWELIHDLLGGTQKMRDADSKWLPKEEAESPKNYERRLNRSVLFPGFKNAIDRSVSRPFSKPVTVKSAPAALDFLVKDADGCSQSISQFARSIFEDLCTYGKAHILVDYTSVKENNEGTASIAQEKAIGARASFARVTSPSLIGWSAIKLPGYSKPVLESIRIREKRTEKVEGSTYQDHEVNYIRVVGRNSFELWREMDQADGDGNQWKMVESGRISLGKVPLVTIYAKQVGFMEADPPFEDLAWLNLAHWQSESDQRNILRVSRFAILFASGLSKEEAENGFTVGPFNTITSSNKDARLAYVEHQGTAIEAGRKDLQDLEARMEIAGMSPFIERSANSTATGKAIDEEQSLSKAQEWVRATEDGLFEAFDFASQWHQVELPKDFGIDIFSDFKVSLQPGDITFLLQLAQAGQITNKTLLEEIKRRGLLADSVDPEQESEEARAELGLDLGDTGTADDALEED